MLIPFGGLAIIQKDIMNITATFAGNIVVCVCFAGWYMVTAVRVSSGLHPTNVLNANLTHSVKCRITVTLTQISREFLRKPPFDCCYCMFETRRKKYNYTK